MSVLGAIPLTGRIEGSVALPRDPMRRLGSYALVYVLAGGGWYADELGGSAEVTAGDLILIFPDLGQAYGPAVDGRWDEVFLLFEGPVFDLWRDAGLLDPARPIVHLEPVERWERRLAHALAGEPLEQVCRLQEVLAAFQRPPAVPVDDELWLERARALLDADVRRSRDLREVAAELHMSYDGFRKRFRRLAGESPARYRWLAAIGRACDLMALGTMSDRQIAAALDFADEFYFSRRFKQVTGRSPRAYRAELARGTRAVQT